MKCFLTHLVRMVVGSNIDCYGGLGATAPVAGSLQSPFRLKVMFVLNLIGDVIRETYSRKT